MQNGKMWLLAGKSSGNVPHMQIRISPGTVKLLDSIRKEYIRIAPYMSLSLTKIGEGLIARASQTELAQLKKIKSHDHTRSKIRLPNVLRNRL